jgi:hypothetical protein
MASKEDVERLLIELELPFERLDDELWVVVNDADQGENLVVYLADSVLTIRVKVFDLPESPSLELYRRLLELNATQVVHGAFGIESDNVVLVGALELENLDRNEFQALVDSFTLALGSHYSELKALLKQ